MNIKFLIVICLLFILGGCSIIKEKEVIKENSPTSDPLIIDKTTPTPETTIIPEITPVIINVDIDSENSINVIVNKTRPLSSDYVPNDLVKPNVSLMKDSILMQREASEAIEEMFNGAKDEGIYLSIGSGYRSYSYQKTLYNNYVNRDGEEAANRYSAKPGKSEHQTGLAADIGSTSQECYLKNCFKDTKEGKWLKENAYLYGFILRYTEEKEDITGYIFEPWHYRYIGKEESLKVFESGLTLEEYYNLNDQ